MTEIELREKLVHIDEMLASIGEAMAKTDRTHQELRLAPWQLVLTGFATAAGVMAATAALVKLFLT